MTKTPVALFLYRRPRHTERMIESLRRCDGFDPSAVRVYCDGSRPGDDPAPVLATRAVARALLGDGATFVESDTNLGLAASIIRGVSQVVEQHGRVVVVEDDLLLHRQFLAFMSATLDRYADEPAVMQGSGYMFPVSRFHGRKRAMFLPIISSQGWCTWKRAWRHFDPRALGWEQLLLDRGLARRFDVGDSYYYTDLMRWQMAGKLNTWGVRWYWSVFREGGCTLFPPQSLVTPQGTDGTGTHGDLLWRLAPQARPAVPPVDSIELPSEVKVHPEDLSALQRELWALSGGPFAPALRAVRRLRFVLRAARWQSA